MKYVYYTAGPDTITAGIAGAFTRDKARPVSNRVADLLLARPEFREADPDTPRDDDQNIAALEAAAREADAADEKSAKEKAAADKSAAKKAGKEEVTDGTSIGR